MQPAAEPGSQRHRGWLSRWWLHGALVAAALIIVTVGRAAYECQSQLRQGRAADRAGGRDEARLHYGEALLWRVPLVSSVWADAALRSLDEMPPGPRAALAGAARGSADSLVAKNNDLTGETRFGRVPKAALALLGGLALVAGLAAAARWAWTARRSWAVVTLASAFVAAIALWAA